MIRFAAALLVMTFLAAGFAVAANLHHQLVAVSRFVGAIVLYRRNLMVDLADLLREDGTP